MHHNMVLMRDAHAGLAQVLEEIRSVNPNMHHHHTARATDETTREAPSGRGEAKREEEELEMKEQMKKKKKRLKCMDTEGFLGRILQP